MINRALFMLSKHRNRVLFSHIFLSLVFILLFSLYPNIARATNKLSLSESAASFTGENRYDNSGADIAYAGDVNGDGYDDFLIGAPNNDDSNENAGKCYLILGRPQNWQMDQGLGQAGVGFLGEAAGDKAGLSVSYAGDVNGDGYDDFLVGAPNNDDSGEDTGKCYLFFGRKSWNESYNLAEANVVLTGERERENTGLSLSYAGDVNADGYDDFLIGSHGLSSSGGSNGECHLIFGRKKWNSHLRLYYADASFVGEDLGDRFGVALSYAGDVNGDGYDDFLIGAPNNNHAGKDSGQSYLVLGRKQGWQKKTPISLASASFIGENANDNAGISLAYAGDVNKDGYADILIGADANSETGQKAGKCYLLLGKAAGWKLRTPLSLADAAILGERAKDRLGVSVSYAGDINGDGLDDFMIGASRSNEGKLRKCGKSYLFWGRTTGFKKNMGAASANLILIGEARNDLSGNSLSFAGDINGDGVGDILIGADANSESGRSSGQTYLLFPKLNTPPKTVSQIKLKTDNTYQKELKTEVRSGGEIYIQLQGQDANPHSIDTAQVIVGTSLANFIRVGLVESRSGSGVYQGSVKLIGTSSSRFAGRLKVNPGEVISIKSKDDERKQITIAQGVSLAGYDIDDNQKGLSQGNGNGHIEAGETVELNLRLTNNYFKQLAVTARLESKDPYIRLLKPSSSFGTIPSSHTQAGRDKLVLAVSKGCPSNHSVNLKLIISHKKRPRWVDTLQFSVAKLVTVSGQIRDRHTGQVIKGAQLKYGKHTIISKADGSYAAYLKKSPAKEEILVSAPHYLKTIKQVECKHDQQLDILLSPRLKLEQAQASFVGEEKVDASGYALSYAGDVNGDGFDDFLIGAPGNDAGGTDAGQTYLILGQHQGWQENIDLSKASASFVGQHMFDESGKALAHAGDVNGDGFDDFLIGAPGNDRGGDKAGQVYLIFGRAQGWKLGVSLDQASASFVGETLHNRAGSAISYAGDVNGDGYDDFLIGAWDNNAVAEDAGQTYLIFGKAQGWQMYASLAHTNATFVGENARDESGKSLSYAGDVNGDGYDDFLIGAPSYNAEKPFVGKSYLVLGRPSGWRPLVSLDSAASFVGEGTNDASGSHLAYAGDVNGDGYSDFLVCAWSNDEGGANAGQVYLFLGKSEGWENDRNRLEPAASFIGEQRGDAAGFSAAYAGDVNGDGYDDFLIGAWGSQLDQSDQGQSYLILGKSDGWEVNTSLSFADLSFVGHKSGDAAGRALSFVGDVNGDGYDDFLIGAWGNDQQSANAGKSYLIWLAENSPPHKVNALELIPPAFADDEQNRLRIKLIGEDSDPERINVALVLLDSTSDYADNTRLKLIETTPNSGEYIGGIRIASTSSNPLTKRILANGKHSITVSAKADGSVTKSIKLTDTRAPFISRRYPPADEQRAPINADIRLWIRDPGSGVDKSSLVLNINHQPVQFEISGNKHNYELFYRPSQVFGFEKIVNLDITAEDLAQPPNILKTNYSFKTAKTGIILNPGFEEDFTQWKYQSVAGMQGGIDQIVGAITTIDPTTARSGIKSCKVEFAGDRDLLYEHLYQGPISVEPNTDYLLQGYVKTENLSSNEGVRLYVAGCHDPYRETDPDKFFEAQSNHLLETNGWTLLSVPFTTQADTNYVFVYLLRHKVKNGGRISGTCWLDDLYLMVESEPGFSLKSIKGKLIEYFR